MRRSSLSLAALLASAGLLAGCSGSSSGGGVAPPATQPFEAVGVSFQPGDVFRLNQGLEVRFNQEVDLLSASGQNFLVRTLGGVPAVGSLTHKATALGVDETVLVFTPRCPREQDLSDAGLLPSEEYLLRLEGGTGTAVLRSKNGDPLRVTLEANFETVDTVDPAAALQDSAVGPPMPVVREVGSTLSVASYLELGTGAPERVYLEVDPLTSEVAPEGGLAIPLNLYGDPGSRVVFALRFNQSVRGDDVNLSRVGLEYLAIGGVWRPLETRVTLVSDCGGAGDEVRLEAVGCFPAGRRVRAVVHAGFQDLVGETLLLDLDGFAEAETRSFSFPALGLEQAVADEFREDFDFGGDDEKSFESDEPLLGAALADWGQGSLASSLGLRGGGGPGGNFDVIVQAGELLFLDTAGTTIVGGPDGVPTATQTVTDGRLELRNLRIEEGGEIRVLGPFPLVVEATGTIEIEGELSADGLAAPDVASLNTGQFPSLGGAGVAGGGRGGIASGVTNGSTPRGGGGFGAFQLPDGGGQGGESSYSPASNGKDARRPGGGGGGRFAADQGVFVAETGFNGSLQGRGAETGIIPALGGQIGPDVFTDGNPANDFFGEQPVLGVGMNQVIGVIRGELSGLWAGAGGGGGGDAVPSPVFPQPNWNPGSDEKGGGGGGGGGAIHLRSLGPIVFGPNSSVHAEGGRGGLGENTLFLDHIGGSGGSGSGGHIILESATRVDLSAVGTVSGEYREAISARGGPRRTGPDTTGGDVSFGGAGGPGLIQINVPKPTLAPGATPQEANILVPGPLVGTANPLDALTAPTAVPVLPTIGSRSRARSRWIPVGGASGALSGGLLQFLFGGVETTEGAQEGWLLGAAGEVTAPAPILGPIAGSDPNVTLLDSGAVLRLGGDALQPLLQDLGDVFLRTPALLEDFEVRLASALPESSVRTVVAARYDPLGHALDLVLSEPLGSLDAQAVTVVPRFFRVRTDGVADALPPQGYVKVLFQAAADDGTGAPDEAAPLVDWTGDVASFNRLEPDRLAYFRFEVEFELNAAETGIGPDAPQVELDFLRLPFRF